MTQGMRSRGLTVGWPTVSQLFASIWVNINNPPGMSEDRRQTGEPDGDDRRGYHTTGDTIGPHGIELQITSL